MDRAVRTTHIKFQSPQRGFMLEVFDNPLCVEVARSILAGKTYPRIEFINDVKTVVDVGANVGAASLHFAHQYPAASLHSFEPCPDTYRLLSRNLAHLPNAHTYNVGLFDRECRVPLYLSKQDAVTNSIGGSYLNSDSSVEVDLRSAREFLRNVGLGQIDILKIDTEGCELPILISLADFLEQVRVIYLEYHDEADRLAIDALLRKSHILTAAKLRHPHRGELCYVAYASFPSAAALDRLRIPRESLAGSARCLPASLIEMSPPRPPIGRCSPYQVAVVIPTILRPSLRQAVQSVFAQRLAGPGQLLIGVDRVLGDPKILDEIRAMRPANWTVDVFDPGYSTSIRHGGLHPAKDGGALRTILSYAANSRYVAYLDDDNAWTHDHLPSLLAAIGGYDWAYSARWFADPITLEPLCMDNWESVGPDRGVFREKLGGFVDPNTLLIDKLACEPVLRWWAIPVQGDPKGMSADRNVFNQLKARYRGVATNRPTCVYRLNPGDGLHKMRMEKIHQAKLADRHG